jgi:hypothetical protein
MRRSSRTAIMMITAAFVLACAVPALAPTPAPEPVFDPNSINTAIVLTAEFAATQTAAMMPPTLTPTVTMLPSKTPLPTETPTATFVFLLPTPTVPSATPTIPTFDASAASAGFACRVDSKAPADGSTFSPGANFDAHWLVTNIGKNVWDKNNADYRYVSGDRFYRAAAYDMNVSVSPGEQADISAAMKAPDGSGTYKTTWKIVSGKNTFCTMNLTIVVK